MIPPEERYPHAPLPFRPRLTWPGGARLAVWVCPNIEHYEFLPAQQGSPRDPWPRTPHPDVLSYSLKDYGNRAGVWRMMDCLDTHGIRGSVSFSMSVGDMFPEILDGMLSRDWDVFSHGLFNTRYHWNLPEDDERAEIEASVAAWKRLTGKQLRGWFSPAASNTLATPDLVAEAGISYLCDFYHDDQPTPIRVRSGKLVSIPYSMDLNDAVMIGAGAAEGADFLRAGIDMFETLYAEGAVQPRVMCIALHPYIMGRPHRIRFLDALLAHIRRHEGVWFATGAEMADWYLAQHYDAALAG
ncbi:polysaccharide deacetylase family protein [Falsiroseomonas sp.]|uniref:polysaccharide deacetylase family protein n=1 Tax=Falsiroseomonas sp. TaxID=2870721 RepID=UPI0027336A5A|nr:polysaccharide deacetylase family protein [Falsiroseomonas sp.]MDP3418514.1 polysaccharide deacetylase family protein [Falsiroseomonas sp.]